MTSLVQLSDDALLDIVHLVMAEDVFCLLLSGEQTLIRRLKAKITKIRSQRPKFGIFPFSIFSLLSVQEIVVEMMPCVYNYPLQLQGKGVLPDKPMPSVTKLNYSFAQSFASLSTDGPLSSVFPNLVTLQLKKSLIGPTKDFVKALPRTLVNLSILVNHCINEDDKTILNYSDLNGLPDGLETFEMSFVNLEGESSELRFPVRLRSLSLGVPSDMSFILHCPATLTRLKVTARGSTPIKVSELPPGLTYLKLACSSIFDNSELILDQPFPSCLTNLSLPSQPFGIDEMRLYFPSTLTKLGLDNSMSGLGELFPFLEELISSETDEPEKVQLSNLKTLESASHQVSLPPSLTYLGHPTPTPEQFSRWHFSHLTSLIFNTADPKTLPFPSSAWIALRPSLTQLTASIACFENADILQSMRQLKTLSLHIPAELDPDYLNRLGSPFLPTSLTTLSLRSIYDEPSQTSRLPLLQHLNLCSNLNTLYLSKIGLDLLINEAKVALEESDDDDNFPVPLITHHPYLAALPRTVTQLGLSLPNWLSTDCVLDYPPNLITLIVNSVALDHPVAPQLTNEHFSKLPHSLTSLNIMGINSVNVGLFDVIPPTLSQIRASSMWDIADEWDKASLKYFNHARWQGLCPEDRI